MANKQIYPFGMSEQDWNNFCNKLKDRDGKYQVFGGKNDNK